MHVISRALRPDRLSKDCLRRNDISSPVRNEERIELVVVASILDLASFIHFGFTLNAAEIGIHFECGQNWDREGGGNGLDKKAVRSACACLLRRRFVTGLGSAHET